MELQRSGRADLPAGESFDRGLGLRQRQLAQAREHSGVPDVRGAREGHTNTHTVEDASRRGALTRAESYTDGVALNNTDADTNEEPPASQTHADADTNAAGGNDCDSSDLDTGRRQKSGGNGNATGALIAAGVIAVLAGATFIGARRRRSAGP